MADGSWDKRTGFDLAALPDGPFGTIVQSLGTRDKIRLQSVSKALRHALQKPEVPKLWGDLSIELNEDVLTRNGRQDFLHSGAFKLVQWVAERCKGIGELYLRCSLEDVPPSLVSAAAAAGWQLDTASPLWMHAFLDLVLPALLTSCQGSGMGLRLRCDWGNPFSCALFAADGSSRQALAEMLTGLTVSHYSWSLSDQHFQDLCCLTNLRQLGIETRLPSLEIKRIARALVADGAYPGPLPPLGLAALPNDICKLSKLEVLCLDGHPKLSVLPPALCAMPALRELHLGCGDLSPRQREVKDCLQLLATLCTSVAELPASLSRLRRLQTLAVACSYVHVTVAPGALGGPALQACRFKRVTIAADNIESASLQSLLLEGCSGSVDFGANLPALRKLELTSRHLPIPDSIADLRALQKLDLREHMLTALPEALGALAALRKLDLRCNRLAAVPGVVRRLRALEHLNASSQYELHSRAAFDIGSLDVLHDLPALTFVALEDNGFGDRPEAHPAVAAAAQRFCLAQPACTLRLAR